jgi:hypothetical protein
MLVIPIINQTGGANGITRGLYVNPTLTAAADWRSIEWSNNSGWGLYGAGTANNYLGGSLGIGATTLTGYNLRIGKDISGASGFIGLSIDGLIQPSVTSAYTAFRSRPNMQTTTFNLSVLSHFVAQQGNISGGATVTDQYGFLANNELTNATNNYGFFGNIPNGTNRWNIYMNGTADNYLAGKLLIGTTTVSTFALDVNGTARVSGALTINTSGQGRTITTFSGANSDGQNMYVGGGGASSVGVVGETFRGSYNSSLGVRALQTVTTGNSNTASGYDAMALNTTGSANAAFGVSAIVSNTSGIENTALGFGAGYGVGTNANTTGSNNIFIGSRSIGESASESNRTFIGNTSTTSTWLGGNLLIGTRTNGASFINVGAGTTAKSQINLASSTAPTSPVNGDIWFDGTDLKMRIGGVTKTFTLV